MPGCPSDAEFAGLLNGVLAPERTRLVRVHVSGCKSCRERLARLTRDTNGAPSIARSSEAPATISAPSFSEAHTLVLSANTPLLIPRPSGLPRVPGFEIMAEIGRGGMGVVYKARHQRLNRLVALKMVLTGIVTDPRTVQRFLFEAEILARVQHPQIVQVYEVDTFASPSGVPVPYLAIELLEGGSLGDRLKGGPLEPRAAAQLVEGIARAVHAVHLQGVIHRDLKPGNILFPKDVGGRMKDEPDSAGSFFILPPSSLPKVTDFGLAKLLQAGADLTVSGQVVGTPHYMAPEQAAGSKQVGPAVDVYALGAILYECLSARPPFQGAEPMSVLVRVVTEAPPDIRALRPNVPRDLGAVVMRCLNKDPRHRYASAEELANDLNRFLENRPTRARPISTPERVRLWAKRNPAVAGLMLALATVLVVAFGAVTYLWIEARETAQREHTAKEQAELAEGQTRTAHETTTLALGRAQKSEAQALDANKKATETLAHLEFARAMTWCEEGRVREGLEVFVRVVELAEATGAADLARVARINIAAWPRELPPPRRALPHAQQPRHAVFHPDGQHLITAGRGSAVHLWNIATGTKVRSYRAAITKPFYRLTGITYWIADVSPDGKTIAAGSSDGHITVWNTDSPEPRLSFDALGIDENVWAVAFAPDGTLWANDGRDGLSRWDISKRKAVRVASAVPRSRSNAILQLIVPSPDGSRLYTGDRAGFVREWDAATATELRSWNTGGWVQDLALSPEGTRVAATGPEGVVKLIDLTGKSQPRDLSLSSAYGNGVAFAPTAPFLFTADGDGNLRFWHRETLMRIGHPMRFSGEVTRIRFRPHSGQFAVMAGDSVFLCTIPDPPYDLITAGHGRRLRGLAISAAGDRVAVSDDDGFELFDPYSARRLQRVDYAPHWPDYRLQESPLHLRFDPDPARARVFRGTREGFDTLAVPDGRRVKTVTPVGAKHIYGLDFLPGSNDLLVAGANVVARWDTRTLRDPTVAPVEHVSPGMELRVIAARPDGREILVAFANQIIFLDPNSLLPARPGWSTRDEVRDAKYTPDGSKVLLGRRDNMAELRSATDGTLAAAPMPHSRAVLAVAVSPNGAVLVTASRDGTARFWDAATGLPLGGQLRHIGPVTHLVYGPKGDHIVTGTGTGNVLLWDVPPPPAPGTLADLRATIDRRD